MRFVVALILAVQAGAAWAQTDFGVRQAPAVAAAAQHSGPLTLTPIGQAPASAANLSAAVRIGAQWGRVTSTLRSAQHNRRVGGVRNSYHLVGRAIDIARRPGVRHHQIAAALRAAGYVLVESLDEGDHSHFAFGSGYVPAMPSQQIASGPAPKWKVIFAPR
jgi:hypothetical protein